MPDIQLTLERYLNAVQTFTPSDQLETTSGHVQDLMADEQKIQAIKQRLQQAFESQESWVSLVQFYVRRN